MVEAKWEVLETRVPGQLPGPLVGELRSLGCRVEREPPAYHTITWPKGTKYNSLDGVYELASGRKVMLPRSLK